MALTYKVRYKNHCTPQEQILTDGRFATLSAAGTLTTGVPISTSATIITAPGKDFIYIKNTGSTEIVISLSTDYAAQYVIALAADEVFASEINTVSYVRAKTLSGTSTIEHFTET